MIWLKKHQDESGWDAEWFRKTLGRPIPDAEEPRE